MKRRSFIKNSSQAGVALSILGLAACKNDASKNENADEKAAEMVASTAAFFKLSLAQWSIHRMIQEQGLDPFAFAEKANSWGFSGLEYVSQLYNDYLGKFDNQAEGIQKMVSELNMRSKDHGMENVIMMVDLPGDSGALSHPDAAIRNKAIENHHIWADATAGLGCHSMRVNLFGSREPEAWKEYSVESLNKLCEYADQQGINIIVENHGWLSSDAALLAEVIESVDQPNAGTLPDFGNFCTRRDGEGNWGGECIEEYDMYKGVKELMPLAKGVSAKSYEFDTSGRETTIDFERMLKIVKDSGYSGYIGVEFEGSGVSEEQGILATKDLLLSLAEKLS
ncbi:sugar phosphate isomerase/epimerase family protein [Robertkochia aurantiaca]|uniref:sugar phosphate isomerase/epimerase family protein n=1 Tax=Robertkochia aurantiaca TaxID=2873700 RepID=UPI001CCF1EB3|nr:sugar phosphate isomerase/epimerase family protein [Robertkochia sp. 3YJGBD-33]